MSFSAASTSPPSTAMHPLPSSAVSLSHPQQPRFIMDISLYRFAKQLRLFGCDVVCDPSVRFAQLLVLARKEGRVVLATPGRLVPQLERLERLVRAVDAEAEADAAAAAAAALHARRRRLVGYNSDGESEYEDDTADAALVAATAVLDPAAGAVVAAATNSNGKVSNNDAVLAAAAMPIAASQPFRYIVVDCHGDFKAELRRVVVQTGVTWDPNVLFTRCVKCNAELRHVQHKTDVEGRVTPGIYRVYSKFYECPLCLKVFWGVNEGTIVNFKSARTAEFLRSIVGGGTGPVDNCLGGGAAAAAADGSQVAGGDTITIQRHLFSLPRRVKVCIFSFLTDAELDTFVVAAPLFRELSSMFRKGLILKFVPEWKRNGRRNPKWAAHEAEQNRRLAEYEQKQQLQSQS